jgi:tetratricopeptide (TPR) repeat protein
MMHHVMTAACCCLLVLGTGCQSPSGTSGSQSARLSQIEASEQAFRKMLEKEADLDWASEEVQDVVSRLLRQYAEFANGYRGDSLAPVFLMRRADLLQGKGAADAAVRQWIDVAEGFPRNALAPQAIFQVGFIRETALKDTLGALKAYSELIQVYPESHWAEQAGLAAQWLTFKEGRLGGALEEGAVRGK